MRIAERPNGISARIQDGSGGAGEIIRIGEAVLLPALKVYQAGGPGVHTGVHGA